MTHIVSDDYVRKALSSHPLAGQRGLTAVEIGISAARLKATEGITVVGTQQTGKPGRPALLFGLAD